MTASIDMGLFAPMSTKQRELAVTGKASVVATLAPVPMTSQRISAIKDWSTMFAPMSNSVVTYTT